MTVLFDINYGKIFDFTWFLFFVSVADLSPILVLAYKSSEKNCVLLLLFRRYLLKSSMNSENLGTFV